MVSAKARLLMKRLCIRYLMDLFLLLAESDVDIEADLARNCKSSMIVYGNIRCTGIKFGTLWRMHRQCVPGPLFGPGDEAIVFTLILKYAITAVIYYSYNRSVYST